MTRLRKCRRWFAKFRPALYCYGTVLVGMFMSVTSTGAPGDGWFRYLVPIGHGPPPDVPFTIGEIGSDGGVILARGWYCYTQRKDPVVLHGKKDPEGPFHPVTTYEVATEGKTQWRKLEMQGKQSDIDSISASTDTPLFPVAIDMEPFRAVVGVYRYGRLVLENGDSAIIALEDLLPTANARDALGNFSEDVSGGDTRMRMQGYKTPRPSDRAQLVRVVSLGDRLIGEFVFGARDRTVRLEGAKTPDGDFWPTATFEYGDSDKDWIAVGNSKGNGTPGILEIPSGQAKLIRFVLSDYKAEIGKHEFGKITFSNGESVVFYLQLLDPRG